MANFRNRRLLDVAHNAPCFIRVSGCSGGHDGNAVPCHSNLLRHGRGTGLKSHDCFHVPGCSHCHYWLDYGKDASREEKEEAFMRAFEAYILWLWREGKIQVTK